MLLKIWTRLRAHLWAYVSTIFLATCVGALALAIAGPARTPSIAEAIAAAQPRTIHIGGLTMHVAGSEVAGDAVPAGAIRGTSFDLSLLIPELVQGAEKRPANAEGMEWQTQVSVAVYSAKMASVSREGASHGDNLPAEMAAPAPATGGWATLKTAAAIAKCLSPSMVGGNCEGVMPLGNGVVLHYALSRVLGRTPDMKDRLTQVATLLGFPSHMAATPNAVKAPDRKGSPVEIAGISRNGHSYSKWH